MPLSLRQLEERAQAVFYNLQVYKNPDGSGWIAHGIHRQTRRLLTTWASDKRGALKSLLVLADREEHHELPF